MLSEIILSRPVILFRAMKADGGVPRTGASATTLGARLRYDLFEAEDGTVRPETGGISVTPGNPAFLPMWAQDDLRAGRLELFLISTRDLGPDLVFRSDPDDSERHGFVEPNRSMTFDEYQQALWDTRERWRLARDVSTVDNAEQK